MNGIADLPLIAIDLAEANHGKQPDDRFGCFADRSTNRGTLPLGIESMLKSRSAIDTVEQSGPAQRIVTAPVPQ